MRRRTLEFTGLVLVLLMLVALLPGCSTLKVGWVETSLPGTWHAHYSLFTGRLSKRVAAEQGDTIKLQYESEVTAGPLTMEIADPDGETVARVPEGKSGELKVEAKQTGTYRIHVNGSKTRGRFSLEWKVE